MPNFFRACAMCCVLGAPIVYADTITLRSDPFNEVLREAAQISGVLVAGMLLHGEADSAISLAAAIPPGWSGRSICVRVVTADGLYEAANEYEVSASWTGGVAELPFPTQHGDLLSTLAPDMLAVRVASGACDERQDVSALALWNAPTDGQGPTLLVNAFRAKDVILYVDGRDDPITCRELDVRGMIAFDHGCALPPGLRGEVSVTVYRLDPGRQTSADQAVLWLGTPP